MTYSHGVAQIPWWIWLVVTGVFIGLPAIAIAAAVLLRRGASRSVSRHAGSAGDAARSSARRATRCGLAGLGAGVLLGVALVLDNRAGLGVLTCAAGYLAGVLVGEYTAQPPARGRLRTARLLARRPTDYVPRWAAAAAVVVGAVVLAAPIVYAVAPAVHFACPPRTLCFGAGGRPVASGQTSWPTWPGTAAAAVLTVAMLAAGVAGLRRVAARPEPASGSEQAVDEVLRRQAGRAILGAVLGLELFVLSGVLIAGASGLAVPFAAARPGAYLGSRIMSFAGLGCAAVGIASWLVLSGWTNRRPAGSAPPDPAVSAPDA